MEPVLEACLSCGRVDQPERLHTHITQDKNEKIREKSPLKEQKNHIKNSKESSRRNVTEEIRGKESRRQRKSQSPKKSVEKNLALSEVNGESPSPKVKRKPRKSEKENESSTHVIDSYKNMKKSIKQKSENRPKPRNDFTVDIFTSKTTEEKEIENINHANDDKTLALQDCDDLDVVSITSRSPSQGSRPTVKCSTCSKEFGKASIKFHEPQWNERKLQKNRRK